MKDYTTEEATETQTVVWDTTPPIDEDRLEEAYIEKARQMEDRRNQLTIWRYLERFRRD
jgi:hypothetical protein